MLCRISHALGAEVPELNGVVLTLESQAQIPHATIVIALEGTTLLSELPMYRGASHSSGRRCVARMVVQSDDAGRFALSSSRINGHAGDPEFRIIAIKDGYRSKVDGKTVAATNPANTTITMWSDADALRYNALSGGALDLERVADRVDYIDNYLSRHGFLADLIAYSGIARRCERELSEGSRRALLTKLFSEWVASAPDTPKATLERAVCDELELARREFPALLAPRDKSVLGRLCPSLGP